MPCTSASANANCSPVGDGLEAMGGTVLPSLCWSSASAKEEKEVADTSWPEAEAGCRPSAEEEKEVCSANGSGWGTAGGRSASAEEEKEVWPWPVATSFSSSPASAESSADVPPSQTSFSSFAGFGGLLPAYHRSAFRPPVDCIKQ